MHLTAVRKYTKRTNCQNLRNFPCAPYKSVIPSLSPQAHIPRQILNLFFIT